MSGGTEGTPLNLAAAKKAGRDLMPIIVIFVFAIIMTVVSITVFSFTNGETTDPETLKHQEKLRRQDEIFSLMQQGFHALSQKNNDAAIHYFEKTLGLLGNQDQPILRFELNRYLAEAELARGNRARAEEYWKTAEKYRSEIRDYLDTELNSLQKKMEHPDGEKKP